RLHLAFGDEAPSNRIVYNWFAEFQSGRTFLCDDFREGRPSTSVVATNVDSVREMIERDRHMTYFLSSKNVELMTHCPYSPDLSSNDFFLFPNIKKKMRGKRFESPEAAVDISYADF
ncbi:GVQW3 protein, partial [Acromyrmex heyeri]